MGRPREHDADTAAALLDAAEALLAEGGPPAVSVRSVADAVGTTTRAVYSLFGSKDGLVQALARRGYELLAQLVNAVPETDDPALDLVEAGLHGFRTFALERPHLFRLTFERVRAEVSAAPDVRPAATSSLAALERRIRRAQEAGMLRPMPTIEVAFAYHALCQGLASNELLRQPPPVGAGFWQPAHGVDLEHVWRTAVTALVAGLAPVARTT